MEINASYMGISFVIFLEVNYRPYLEILLFVFLIVVIAFLYLELRKRNVFIQTIIENIYIFTKSKIESELTLTNDLEQNRER